MASFTGYVAATALLTLTYITYILFFSSDRKIPGPLVARFTTLWYTRALLHGDLEKINLQLHKKYGPVVRLAPGYYSISDSYTIRKIYNGPPNDPNSDFDKSSWYNSWFLPGSRILFNEPSARIHAQMRRWYDEAYSMSFMTSLQHYVDECIVVFGKRLEEFCKAGKPVDLAWWFQCFTTDAVGMTTYGQRFGYLDEGKDIEEMLGIVHANTSYGAIVGSYHWLHPFIFCVMQFGSKLGLNDQLDKFLAYQDEHPDSFTDSNILDVLCANLVAGSDTTAITLCALIYHVHKSSRILAKLREEIDRVSTSTYKESLSLLYLQATISETLRLHPAVGLPLWRKVPSSGLQVGNITIPPDSNVGGNAWVLHHDQEIFGPDADVFRPERWLEIPIAVMTMKQFDMSFGAGSRTCMGKNVSLIEMAKLVPELLRRFDFELVDEEWETSSLWFVAPKRLMVKVRMR